MMLRVQLIKQIFFKFIVSTKYYSGSWGKNSVQDLFLAQVLRYLS